MISLEPLFWRDPELPYVELRQVLEGGHIVYSPHSHREWSIGAILLGQSEFACADRLHIVKQGTLVMMNPEEVHACKPKPGSPWAYYMMHLDKEWLGAALSQAGVRKEGTWRDMPVDTLSIASYYQGFLQMVGHLMSTSLSSTEKEESLVSYLTRLFVCLDSQKQSLDTLLPPNQLYQVADYLSAHCMEDLPIEQISKQFGYSTGYLVRTFKKHFHMTPHAYRLNQRVRVSQQALKAGHTICDVAHNTGFSDQAHFQRVFKQRVAATPNQYRRSVSSH